ncbi:MAG: DUF1800 family protein [Planctomycetia bacterium]|nr:DUF1800 family protein [Planctomycetia bacterium]
MIHLLSVIDKIRKKSWISIAAILFCTVVVASPAITSSLTDDSPEKKKAEVDPKTKLLGIDGARHLLDRTVFGGSPESLNEYAKKTRKEAVDQLLSTLRVDAVTPLPSWSQKTPAEVRKLRNQNRAAFGKKRRQWENELRIWWTREFLSSPSPLTERLVLLWHGHFTSEMQKVRSPHAMLKQNNLFRTHAAGDYNKLLHAVALDPAMILYLDTHKSKKGSPNENFARELFELFGLGEGHYTERDIKEAASAFTGYSINPETGNARLIPRQHDSRRKTVLGRTGNFKAPDIVDSVLSKKACSEWIAQKFWKEFVSPTPDEKVVSKWAAQFRLSKLSIRSLLETILLSETFWSQEYRGALIKSPVDLVIGSLRRLNMSEVPAGLALRSISRLGQNLFDPPNVAGWPGGTDWIDATTLLNRRRFISEQLPTGMIYLVRSKPTKTEEKQKDSENPEADAESMNPDGMMNPKMGESMSDDAMQKERPQRLRNREMRRLRPQASARLEQLFQQFRQLFMSDTDAWIDWWLPLKPVTDADHDSIGFGRLKDVLLDPTFQLK